MIDTATTVHAVRKGCVRLVPISVRMISTGAKRTWYMLMIDSANEDGTCSEKALRWAGPISGTDDVDR